MFINTRNTSTHISYAIFAFSTPWSPYYFTPSHPKMHLRTQTQKYSHLLSPSRLPSIQTNRNPKKRKWIPLPLFRLLHTASAPIYVCVHARMHMWGMPAQRYATLSSSLSDNRILLLLRRLHLHCICVCRFWISVAEGRERETGGVLRAVSYPVIFCLKARRGTDTRKSEVVNTTPHVRSFAVQTN